MENRFRLIAVAIAVLLLLQASFAFGLTRKEYFAKHVSKSEYGAYETLGLGALERINGNYTLALKHTKAAIGQLKKLGKTQGFLYGLANSHAGILSLELGRFKNAREYAGIALKIAERIDNDELRLMSLGELAIFFAISGDVASYKAFRGKVLAVLGIDAGNLASVSVASFSNRLGEVLVYYDVDEYLIQAAKNAILVGDFKLAALFFDTVLQGRVDKKPVRELAASMYGEMVLASGDYAKATRLANEFDNDYLRGRLAYESAQYDSAVSFFTSSLTSNRFSDIDYVYAKRLYLAKAFERGGQLDKAAANYDKANQIVEESRNTLLLQGRKAYLAANEFNVLRSEAHEGLARIHLQQGKTDDSFLHSELSKCRTLLDSLRAKGEEEDSLTAFINALVDKGREDSSRLMEYGSDAYFVCFDVTETALLRFVLYQGKCVRADSVAVSRSELDSFVSRYLDSFLVQSYDDLEKFSPDLSHEFYMTLFDGMLEVIPEGTKIIVSPDESLCSVSFSSLVISTAPKRFLLERNRISSCYSASLYSLLAQREKTGKDRHVAVVDPKFGTRENAVDPGNMLDGYQTQAGQGPSSLSPLPETQAIAHSLKLSFPDNATSLAGVKASLNNVKSIDYDRVRTLTIASHADLSGLNPVMLEPSIYLTPSGEDAASGVLTLSEIERAEIAPDCCFLAACQTGVGRFVPGEGPQSLVYAFHKSGTPNVISSMWPVEVNSTVQMVSSFYDKLAEGTSYSEALRQSQLKAMRTINDHPFFWASFVLHGVD